MITQRSILLVPFPFSDQSGKKVRPVCVVSSTHYNKNSQDLLVAGITSNISKDQYTTLLDPNDLEEGTLHTTCCIKVENILKIDKDLVIKPIGKINKQKLRDVHDILTHILRPD